MVEEFGGDIFRVAHVTDGVACVADEISAATTQGGVCRGEGGKRELGEVCEGETCGEM